MKKLYILPIILLFMNSCIDYESTTSFVLENKSGHNIELHVSRFKYNQSLPARDSILWIENGAIHRHSFHRRGKGDCPFPFGDQFAGMVIYFDDTVSTKYTHKDTVPYNPLKKENYSGGKNPEHWIYTYTYTFTNEDFEVALRLRDSV